MRDRAWPRRRSIRIASAIRPLGGPRLPSRDPRSPDQLLPWPHTPSASITDAEATAQLLGIGHVNYAGLDADSADLVNAAMARAHARGQSLPPVVTTTARPDQLAGGILGYDPESATLAIEPRSPFWADPVRESARFSQARIWATEEPLGLVFHEIGHHNHWLAIGDDRARWLAMLNTPLSPAVRTIARGLIGAYAVSAELEYVAEIYHGIMAGRTYGSDLMAEDNRLGGPAL